MLSFYAYDLSEWNIGIKNKAFRFWQRLTGQHVGPHRCVVGKCRNYSRRLLQVFDRQVIVVVHILWCVRVSYPADPV